MPRHHHADLIIAWANGAEIQYSPGVGIWNDTASPSWGEDVTYRIKPAPKPDVTLYYAEYCFNGAVRQAGSSCFRDCERDTLSLTFDGETGKLKDAKVLK